MRALLPSLLLLSACAPTAIPADGRPGGQEHQSAEQPIEIELTLSRGGEVLAQPRLGTRLGQPGSIRQVERHELVLSAEHCPAALAEASCAVTLDEGIYLEVRVDRVEGDEAQVEVTVDFDRHPLPFTVEEADLPALDAALVAARGPLPEGLALSEHLPRDTWTELDLPIDDLELSLVWR